MSKRVLSLAGFTMDDTHLEIDGPWEQVTPEYVAAHSRSIADEFVTCVCAGCNNGWMQDLDQSFAGTVRRWVDNPSHRLGSLGLAVITRYLLKVLWVKGLGEGWASAELVSDGQINSTLILAPSDGKRIAQGEMGELNGRVSVGTATVSDRAVCTTAVFTPRVRGHSPTAGVIRFSGGMVVALPKLRVQFWLVHRFASFEHVQWPAREVASLTRNTTYGRLVRGSDRPRLEAVEVW